TILTSPPRIMASVVDADGAAVIRGGDVRIVGAAPTKDQIRELAAWVRTRPDDLVESSALSRAFPPSAAYADVASGLLAVPISHNRADQLMWFFREQKQTVRWAGDPRKPVVVDPDGSRRLHPRGSFELWEEEVRGTARP